MAVLNKRAVVSAIEMYGVSAIRLPMVLGESFDQIIKSLFANGEQGFAYDPNDLSTMFQNAAGTVPVTGVGQPVGLVLDKSKGLTLGNEVITNGDFSNGETGWTDTNNWWSIVGGRAYHPASSAYNEFSQSFSAINKLCTVQFDYQVLSGYAQVFYTNYAGTNKPISFPSGSGVFKFIAHDGIRKIAFSRFGGHSAEFYIDNVSVKELAGNHAYQTTSASHPILRKNAVTGAYYLEFDGSDDFLVTNSIDFTSTDKVSLFVGVSKMSSGLKIITELSADTNLNAGSFQLVTVSTPEEGYASLSRGTASAISIDMAISFTYPAPDAAVLSAKHDISTDLSSISRNGVVGTGGVGDQGLGNFGNYPLYIGRRGSASLPFDGHIYGLIGIGKLTSDNEMVVIEKELAKRTGVTLNV